MKITNKKYKFIIIFLSCILILSAAVSVLAFLGKSNSYDEPKFGGMELARFEFDRTFEKIGSVGYLTSGNIVTSMRDGSFIEGCVDGLRVNFEYSNGGDQYVRFKLPEETLVSDFSYITVDFDVFNSENGTTVYSLFRDGETGSGLGTQSVFFTFNKDNLNFGTSHDITSIQNTGWLHITYVYQFINDGSVNMQIYADGKFVQSIENMITFANSNVDNSFEAFTISGNPSNLIIQNIVINGFENGYEGVISRLFENKAINLKDCTDSILYEN